MENKLLAISILIMLTISLLGVSLNILNLAEGQVSPPDLMVEPSTYEAAYIGEIFDINVTISNLDASWKAVAIQFRLCYNSTLLEVMGVTEGPFLKDPRWNLYGTYFINYTEPDGTYGPHVLVGILLLPNPTTGEHDQPQFPEGNGTLATITFKAIYRTIEPAPPAECVLNLTDTMIIDENLNEVEHTTASATYKAKPIPWPKLSVQPDTYHAVLLGEMFNINVSISGLESDSRLVGLQFRLCYNATLLEFVDIAEGSFMQRFNNTATPPFTYFISYVEPDGRWGPHVLVGIQLLPNATGGWTNFPYGSGTLATVTFKAIYQPGEPEPSISSLLVLNDTMLINDDLEEILHTITHGYYEMQPFTFTYQPALPISGEVILFQAPSYPTEVIYSWNFGDGTKLNATKLTVGHAYNKPGNYNVTLIVSRNKLSSGAATKTISVSTGLYVPVEVTVDVGSLHFNGEIVEFSILAAHFGKAVNATNIKATLYYDGVLYAELSDLVELVDTGLYRIPYSIPGDAETGTYTLVVKVEYFNVEGTSMKSFLISPTLTSWGDSIAQITEIKDGIATITTNLGSIKVNLTAINAKLVSINGTVAGIESVIGDLQTNLTNINAAITDIVISSKGEILAKIDSDFGSITTRLDNINATITGINATITGIDEKVIAFQSIATIGLSVASIFSVIAAVAALAVIALLRKRLK